MTLDEKHERLVELWKQAMVCYKAMAAVFMEIERVKSEPVEASDG